MRRDLKKVNDGLKKEENGKRVADIVTSRPAERNSTTGVREKFKY